MPVRGIPASINAFSPQLNASVPRGTGGIGADADGGGSSSSTASSLKTAFNNPVQAFESASGRENGTSNAGATSQQPTLKVFLQDPIQNLQRHGTQAPNSLGAALSTAA